MSLVVCGFGIWVKAEGFTVCSKTRAEQEREFAQVRKVKIPRKARFKLET